MKALPGQAWHEHHGFKMNTDHAGFPETSIFYGRDIKARVHVDWGTFSLVAALKELIMSGLEDRLNQKFMLISESGIPLYPGETMWVELMVEEKSRINACELGVSPFIPCPFPWWRRTAPCQCEEPLRLICGLCPGLKGSRAFMIEGSGALYTSLDWRCLAQCGSFWDMKALPSWMRCILSCQGAARSQFRVWGFQS